MLILSFKRARRMSLKPSFAELAVYHLDADELKNGETLNIDPNYPPGSKTSVLDNYHYRLLKNNEDCDQEALDSAWLEWKRIGMYEHGEAHRRRLLETTKPFGIHLELQRKIEAGLDGSSREIGVFWKEWTAKGLQEAKADNNWVMWKEVEEMTKVHLEPEGCLVCNCDHTECLGVRKYR
jgi:hypothetical protein